MLSPASLYGFSTGYSIFDILLTILLGFILLLCMTNLTTFCLFEWRGLTSSTRQGREPPTLPYTIPYVGHMFQMSDLHGLYDYARSTAKEGPVKLVIGSMRIYLVYGQSNIAELFSNTKYLIKDNLMKQALSASQLDLRSLPGKHSKGEVTSDSEATKIGKKLHDLQHLLLSQPGDINIITEKFSHYFRQELRRAHKHPSSYGMAAGTSGTAVSTGPLFALLKRAMFNASTASLMGPRMLELNPDLVDIYWAYDEAFLLGLPELLYPEGFSNSDRLLGAIQRWIEAGLSSYKIDQPDDSLWEENFGCRLFRQSIRELHNRGLATAAQVNAMLSLVWATASNSVPTTAWMLIAVAEDNNLRSEVVEELSTKTLRVLLESLYLETLRAQTSVTVTRKVATDIEVGGYTLKKGHFVMAPSYIPHTDLDLWSEEEASRASFMPKRFIPYLEAQGKDADSLEPSQSDAKIERLKQALRPENFFPYGGGNAVCPGRFFSKEKILAAVKVFLEEVELVAVERTVHGDGNPQRPQSRNGLLADTRYAGGGTMPPDGDIVVRIRFKNV